MSKKRESSLIVDFVEGKVPVSFCIHRQIVNSIVEDYKVPKGTSCQERHPYKCKYWTKGDCFRGDKCNIDFGEIQHQVKTNTISS